MLNHARHTALQLAAKSRRLVARLLVVVAVVLMGAMASCVRKPLYLLDGGTAEVTVSVYDIRLDLLWGVDWESEWQYDWESVTDEPLGYTAPKIVRASVYGRDDETQQRSGYFTRNLPVSGGRVSLRSASYYDMLFYNVDSIYYTIFDQAFRLTRNSYVNIAVPVKDFENTLVDVYGAGYGAPTMAEHTLVTLQEGAQVKNVFGGGRDGAVYNKASLLAFLSAKDFNHNVATYLADIEPATFNVWKATKTTPYQGVNISTLPDLSSTGADAETRNTRVLINEGALVSANAYGGGYGADAIVSGQTDIQLLGGTVTEDLYGGGLGGDVADVDESIKTTGVTHVFLRGGKARNVFGGGLNGDVVGETHTTLGVKDQDSPTFLDGIPTVERSLYGGGEKGAVQGTAYLTMNNGYVGYKYEGGAFVENIDLKTAGDNLLDENGNAFGAGYGEGASVDYTHVTLYGGTIRNGLYGGGEIAAVGRGTAETNNGVPTGGYTFTLGGETHIQMYSGNVHGDVFGGGRGFSYDLTGNEVVGTTLFSDGYVFGTTDVNIYGGNIGTPQTLADGHGNVFGGGNIGYVYSVLGQKNSADGYYYDSSNKLTEDCHVLVSPYCKVLDDAGVDINGHHYAKNEYVPSDDLNTLKGKQSTDKATWDKLDVLSGINIRNAVFAGGNVSSGSDKVYANAITVFGNVTATLYDIYHRDLITIGTEHTGGLYGDGNLTIVDGYRELNISNYGTDYYGMSDNITIEEYHKLNDRERAYFELKYKCVKDCVIGTTNYVVGSSVSSEDYELFPDEYKNATYFEEAGFCTIYAGRLLNTIQRADFVGVFGSRMVLQGAQDRVPSVVDYTQYTINRIGEVSLNKQVSVAGDTNSDDQEHGNYFGIYNIVNYLGALTSDVAFAEERTTDNSNETYDPDFSGQSYYAWKEAHDGTRKRNNGTCHNKVALASGVYLEITTEESTKDNKVWGPITGVIQLELINVMQGLGGGYVYAKNIHGVPSGSLSPQPTLAHYNQGAVTNKNFTYDNSNLKTFETSGNFIHNVKQIVDDCYPGAGLYEGEDASEAHYWYIKGEFYVYDQYLSAYTGSSTAYKEDINIPLTITAGSHGKMQLMNICPNFYAYYQSYTDASNNVVLGSSEEAKEVIINNVTYQLNDVISYWDYIQLSEGQKALFVPETYVTVSACKIGEDSIPSGTVLLPAEYEALVAAHPTVYSYSKDSEVDVTDVYRVSNDLSHAKGYALTYDVTNPMVWNNWYTSESGVTKKNTDEYEALDDPSNFVEGPTYTPTKSGVYGQRYYEEGDIIKSDVVDVYEALGAHKPTENQASVEPAYVATETVEFTYKGTSYQLQEGSSIPKSMYDDLSAAVKTKLAEAYTCTSTLELGEDDFIFYGELISKARYDEVVASVTGAAQYFAQAYYCTGSGNYGGAYYEVGHNYRTLDAWCSLSAADREYFTYNHDALDLLSEDFTTNMKDYQSPYWELTKVDYSATYRGEMDLTYTDKSGASHTVTPEQVLVRDDYEAIPNEQYHYSCIAVDSVNTSYHIVMTQFTRGEVPYVVGQVITDETYQNTLNDELRSHCVNVNFDKTGNYYFCRESYEIDENGEGCPITDIYGNSYAKNDVVPVGTIITGGPSNTSIDPANMLSEDQYAQLPNKQKDFTIFGNSPTETTTLYVSRESDINDLTKDRIVTVIYQYDYEESDESGNHIEQITERHIVNIHVQFKSGVPTISELQPPTLILPGSTVGLKMPHVTPGAYEILGGGWELFTNQHDAENYKNGTPYLNHDTPMYWYQDGYYAAYYTKTYLGKTYSNAVPFSVANYHTLSDVMADTEHHMYVDHPEVKRDSKIYIDASRENADGTKNELDMFKDMFDLSTTGLTGHEAMDEHVRGLNDLEFFLKGDITPLAYTSWTSIGDGDNCFAGNFHGDGYTISGLSNSLFGHLCGNVYNLGVTGSFTGAGVAETGDGFVQNCWIMTSATPDASKHAVFGSPSSVDAQQIVNSYYPNTLTYNTTDTGHGNATAKSLQAFYNGEVAYDLNGFYLNKRYSDHTPSITTHAYKYYKVNADDNTLSEPATAYYADEDALYEHDHLHYGYVEHRHYDGDFIYADGTIPTEDNERLNILDGHYYPIWPDDYLFFGQALNYGYTDGLTHQETPAHIVKTAAYRLPQTNRNNRVFRAPAYYGDKVMSLTHFNSNAVLPAHSEDNTREAYPGMTAVDFTGHADKSYVRGQNAGFFYTPVLDYSGLSTFSNPGQTQNMLVYADATNDATTYANVLSPYLAEPDYSQGAQYSEVPVVANVSSIHGHLVNKVDAAYVVSDRSHFLVDKQDFNCPITYNIGSGRHMWYQRTPEHYADGSAGWGTVCLPFTADLVTTQTKGEITHFFGDDETKHEYWLREFSKTGEAKTGTTANFARPSAAGGSSVTVGNTFLHDYYYSQSEYDDANADEYFKNYYKTARTYDSYPFCTKDVPYLVGFPNGSYYEFDLSGSFVPANTASSIAKLAAQTITFASATRGGSTQVEVTDDQEASRSVNNGGYIYTGYFQTKSLSTADYDISSAGDSFDKATTTFTSTPFRCYFSAAESLVKSQSAAPRLSIGQDKNAKGDFDFSEQAHGQSLQISVSGHQLIVKSTCETDLNIYYATGAFVRRIHVGVGVNTYDGFRSGYYIVGHQKFFVSPGTGHVAGI